MSTYYDIDNMKIINTKLGYGDGNFITCYLYLEGNGRGVDYGGYILDVWDKEKQKRIGTSSGFQALIEIMNTLEVDAWEEVKGQFVRVESGGAGTKCTRIGHLIKDKWFSFEKHFEENN